ncbi:MAG: YtxH domain-containing protein [Cyanobacteria bacterium]|nr:YtxH domain-containing protein [Cyanobacteriota bacterium]MDA1021196.1 YtxH domain-containing protein [Cyanobacteriota bacterium]
MSNNNNNNSSNFVLGLIFGLAAGFVAGILNATKPGRELRRDFEVNSSDFFETVKEKFEDIKIQAADTLGDFKDFTDEKLKASAQNIETQVESLGKQLEELTKKQSNNFSERN